MNHTFGSYDVLFAIADAIGVRFRAGEWRD